MIDISTTLLTLIPFSHFWFLKSNLFLRNAKAKEHLGQPSENLLAIEFGRKGKPFYVSGPYDNPDKIVAKLRETVGEGNFDYLMLG